MNEHNYTYHDDNFSLDKTEDYVLLIQVENNSFSYAITENGKLIAWAENYPFDELSDPQELLDLLSAKYRQMIIGLPAHSFTLVPAALFSDDRLPNLARFLDTKPNSKVLAQILDKENIIVYNTSETIVNAADEFGIRNTVYTSKGWLTAIAQNNPGNNSLYLNIEKDKVEIAHFSQDKLRFYNSFDFNGDDELVYFAVLVANELSLDAKYTSLYISGNVESDSKSLTRLAEFFGKAEVNSLQVLKLPSEVIAHRVLSISALSLCALSEVV
ncbi:DUF3822 family protein [Mucilaginibacter endophyticus]|uniref:DUF3822 family protein n=1 Tax=Mucilaginibacter endophyticus TaxID=2675003 RepID=UPI000E0CF4D5|nr:DUF3822 family protein [Mucilaginibacter endophyticus]